LIILAIILIDIAVQTLNVLHQTRIISINPAMRSRLSTIFVVSNFIGAAVGSALAGILWRAGGWSAVMTGAAGFLALALAIWFMGNDSNLLIVFYVQIMPDDLVMQLHRF